MSKARSGQLDDHHANKARREYTRMIAHPEEIHGERVAEDHAPILT